MVKTSNLFNKTLVFGVIILFIGIGIQPAFAIVKHEEVDVESTDIRDLIVKVETDKDSYDIGEPVEVTIFVTNTIDEDITVMFGSAQLADFWINDGEVYHWSVHFWFIPMIIWVTIPSGGTVELLNEKWEQIDDCNNQVPAGQYEILGWMVRTSNYSEIFGNPITISIGTKLEIGNVSNSLFNIKTEIRNIGNYNAQGVNWSITFDGNTIILGNETIDKIQNLSVGLSESVSSKFILGLGKCKITIIAEASNAPRTSKIIDGFIIFFLIIIR
jgi:hypothetical protein